MIEIIPIQTIANIIPLIPVRGNVFVEIVSSALLFWLEISFILFTELLFLELLLTTELLSLEESLYLY